MYSTLSSMPCEHFGRLGNRAGVEHHAERPVDERVEQFVVDALEHRPERKQLLLVALFDLAWRSTGLRAAQAVAP